MRKAILIFLAVIGWVTFIIRLYLRVNTPDISIGESLVQYFSYFTILTNLIITIYCTYLIFQNNKKSCYNSIELFNALTAFILFVGVIYAITLRSVWKPEGFTMIQSEIHHTVVPLGFLILWFITKQKTKANILRTLMWMAYPFLYIIFVLIRGSVSNFYPYYFLDIDSLGLQKVVLNSALLLVVLIVFILIVHWLYLKVKLNKNN